MSFDLGEVTARQLLGAYRADKISCREVIEHYLDRIDRFDTNGPQINSIITTNPNALEEANAIDERIRQKDRLRSLEGVPVILKDQVDVAGMPTTLGSVLFKDYRPDNDATIVTKLKNAGAIVLAKATLGELGGGDSHGTLYGSTRNPYDRARTVGGSSGGTAAAIAADFGVLGIGQESFASIRRPAAWTCTVGLRPTSGLVSRAGSYAGGPSWRPSLGPMARSVEDIADLLDVLVGYDPQDPSTVLGIGARRLHIVRRSVKERSKRPASAFCGRWSASKASRHRPIFNPSIAALTTPSKSSPQPEQRSSTRSRSRFSRRHSNIDLRASTIPTPPFANTSVAVAKSSFLLRQHCAPLLRTLVRSARRPPPPGSVEEGIRIRDLLFTSLLKVMTDHELDAIVHKSVEHQPTLIADGINPPYVNGKGAISINTFVLFASSITVPSGFSRENLPTGLTFLGRPYDESALIGLAYDYEQLTHHRRPPDF